MVVVVCMSAARCAELLPHLGSSSNSKDNKNKNQQKQHKLGGGGGGGGVGKLFAKHAKLKDHVAEVAEQKVAVAVGTPHRISALLAAGALVRAVASSP